MDDAPSNPHLVMIPLKSRRRDMTYTDKTKINANKKQGFYKKQLSSAIALGVFLAPGGVLADFELEEIVVTATRRAATVQDIPYNITAVSGEAIKNAGASDLNDLVRMVPGLVSADVGGDAGMNNNLIMRGINASNPGNSNFLPNVVDPAVSTYLNDTPVSLNLKLVDIERVEVLRGPQGTLYGSGSVGGTVRFIFKKPDAEVTSASITAGIGRSAHSDENNHEFEFVGNLPLADDLAVRIAGGTETLGGVTDAIALSQLDSDGIVVPVSGDVIAGDHTQISRGDTDNRKVNYLRGAILWGLSEDTEILLSHFYQKNESDSDTYMRIEDNDKGGEPWEHSRRFLTPGEFEANVTSLEIESDLGFATFTSSTSYTETELFATNDISNLYESLSALYAGAPRLAVISEAESEYEAITQEFRLVSNGEGDWDWVVGAYYNDTDSQVFVLDADHSFEDWLAAMPDGGGTLLDTWNTFSDRTQPFNGFYYQDRQLAFEDKAIFGELTYHVTDEWQLTVGARKFWQEFESLQLVALPFCGAFCADDGNLNGATSAGNSAKFNDEILKFNTSYDLNESTMVYFTWAEGFRHGGANSFPTSGMAGVDSSLLVFEPDEATNWELGIKGTLADNVRYTLSAYLIEWEKVQLDVFLGALAIPGVINGDEARSQGLELEIFANVTENLSVNFGLGYTNSEITSEVDLAGNIAKDGDALPGVPETQASLNVDYYQSLGESDELHYNLNGAYRSSVETNFNDDFRDHAKLNGYGIWNASITWRHDNLNVAVYADNIGDEEALGAVQNERAAYSDVGFIGRPRTVGVRFGYAFE